MRRPTPTGHGQNGSPFWHIQETDYAATPRVTITLWRQRGEWQLYTQTVDKIDDGKAKDLLAQLPHPGTCTTPGTF